MRGLFQPLIGHLCPAAPTAIGAAVMAFGIFITAALQQIPGGASATKPLTAVLLSLWLAVAARMLESLRRHGFQPQIHSIAGLFGIGTWVAGSAIVAEALMLAWPAAVWAARGFLFVSFAIWLCFIPFAVQSLLRLMLERTPHANGSILLATVSTQSVAIVAFRSFPGSVVIHALAIVLMALGAAFYLIGLYSVLRRYGATRNWSLAHDWHNTNCILHGALSITGLAAVFSGALDAGTVLDFWICVLAIFAMVEAAEAARLWARVRHLGWGAAVTYEVSQWARNFTFGMLYAFTLAFAQRLEIRGAHPLLGSVRSDVLAYGQYIVLLLLVIETALALGTLRR
jgi:hypothetical protein